MPKTVLGRAESRCVSYTSHNALYVSYQQGLHGDKRKTRDFCYR